MSDRKDLDRMMKIWGRATRRNLKVVERSDALPHLYHISENPNIKKFIPMVSSRTMTGEDQTIPRICVSASIVETWLGHSQILEPYMNAAHNWGDTSHDRRGYHLYRFNYELAVDPGKGLLPDGSATNEYWLTAYSPGTAHYTAEVVAQMFISSFTVETRKGKPPLVSTCWLIKVDTDSVPLTPELELTKGCYSLTCPDTRHIESYRDLPDLKVTMISDGEYTKQQSKSVSMESLAKPVWLDWG